MSIDLISASLSLLSPFLSDKAGSRPLIRPRLSLFSTSISPSVLRHNSQRSQYQTIGCCCFRRGFQLGLRKIYALQLFFFFLLSLSLSGQTKQIFGPKHRNQALRKAEISAETEIACFGQNTLFQPKKKAVLAVYTLY